MDHLIFGKKSIWIAVAACTLTAGSLIVVGADEPTTKPGKMATTEASIKLWAPYSKLTDLTDVQKSKLEEIHKKAEAQIVEIKKQEDADCREELTDDQKAELDKLEAGKKEAMSAKNKKKRAAATEAAS